MEIHASTNDAVKPVDEQPVDTSMAITSSSDAQHGNSTIHLAAFNNDLDEVQKLVTEDPNVLGKVNAYGNTLLHIAACIGHKDTVVGSLNGYKPTQKVGNYSI